MDTDCRNERIDEIIALEWDMFSRVANTGGRASCQDDPVTFEINRRSQFAAWNAQMLESYLRDLREAEEKGDNPVAFKYGYMMEYSYPDEYDGVRDGLPPVSEEKRRLSRALTDAHLGWRAELLPRFPNILRLGRPERIADETPGITSVESYSLGEFQSMSERTLALYGQYVDELLREGKNMAYMTLDNLARLYGYESLEAAERRIGGQAT
jgi:hypothetical protein